MSENEPMQESTAQVNDTRESAKIDNPGQLLEDSCNKLGKFGGFDLLETVVEGVQNLNPTRKARKKIFLTETTKKDERTALKKTLQLWADMLTESTTLSEMVDKAQAKSEVSEQLLKTNLARAVEATRDLERSYRSVDLFYKNSESDKVKKTVPPI